MVKPSAEPQRNGLPTPGEAARIYAEVAQHASRLLAEHIQRHVTQGLHTPSDEFSIAQTFLDMMGKLLTDPYRLAQAQMNQAWDYFSLWQHSMLRAWGLSPKPVITPARDDIRFKDDGWQDHFLFDFIKQSYLIAARHIHDAVSQIEGLDESTRQKVNSFTRQYIDALSPSNFFLTNPEVFRTTLNCHGQNLIKGFNKLLHDLEESEGQLRSRMSNASAFEPGKNIATTPGKVVFQNELMQLIQYQPGTARVWQRPLLIVPPWINKYYILDLRENNSFVKWAIDQGHTVFVISWINPDARLAHKSFDDYVTEGLLAAVDTIEDQTGEKLINAIGYCLGGTLLASTLAYMASKRDKRVASATFFASLLDFSQPGELGIFIDEEQIAGLEKRLLKHGYLESSEMADTFNMLRANDLVWTFVVNNYLLGSDPLPFDLLRWNADATRLPAKMHSFYLRKMYIENALCKPGGIEICGRKIDLGKIKQSCYFITTLEDHISPWKSCYQGARCLGGPVRFVLGGSGHVTGIINPPAAGKYGFWAGEDPQSQGTQEDWLDNAVQQNGSWWPDWQTWITAQDKTEAPARDPAKGRLPILDDAPGTYVKMRLGRGVR